MAFHSKLKAWHENIHPKSHNMATLKPASLAKRPSAQQMPCQPYTKNLQIRCISVLDVRGLNLIIKTN